MDLENLKHQIKDYELDFDQSEVWANIEQEQSKGKRRVFFWLSSLLGALALIVGVFHIVDNAMVPLHEESDKVSSSMLDSDRIVESNSTTLNDNQLAEATLTRKTKNDSAIDLINKADGTSQYVLNQNAEVIDQKSNKVKHAANNADDDVEKTINVIQRNYTSSSNNISSSIEMNRSIALTNTKSESSETMIDNYENNSMRSDLINKPITSINNEKPSLFTTQNNETLSENRKEELLSSRTNITVQKLNVESYLAQLISDNVITLDYAKPYTFNQTRPLKNNNRSNITLGLIAEYGMTNRTLSLSNANTNPEILSERENSESSIDHAIIGATVSLPISNVFYIGSGLEYHRMSDKVEFNDTSIRPLDPEDLPASAQDAHGFVISKTTGTYYNHLNLVNIPIEIGARWTQSRFSEFVSVGTSINLHTSSRQLSINRFQNLENNSRQTKTRLNNSYAIRAGVAFSLLPQLDWNLQASYRYTPSVTTDDSDFDQSYQSYMIGTGFGYRF